MDISENFSVSFQSLKANKVRATLTMLGIIIGVGAVIAMISLGEGARQAVQARIRSLGSNLLFVRAGAASSGHIRLSETNARLTLKDVDAIQNECAGATYIVPEYGERAQAKYRNKNWNTFVNGVTPDYRFARNAGLQDGEYFTVGDVGARRLVCLIGKEIVTQLFGDVYPIGEIIKIRGLNFTVIGILQERGASFRSNEDDVILIPISTAQKRVFGTSWISSLDIAVSSPELMDNTSLDIERALRKSHRLQFGKENDFNIRSQVDIISTMEETSQTFTTLLAGIALVSLLVGGIGIMNIMLVSVTERTREIGVRKAVGARRRDILFQFLTEAAMLSSMGGLVGVAAGIGGSLALNYFAQWNTLISESSVMIAFVFSAVVGIFFGIYPAARASKLDPIEALRYE